MSPSKAGSERGGYDSATQRERRARILSVARREISARGYDGLTMKHLASASDVALKTLYNLFGSKDELLLAAVTDLLADLRARAGDEQPAPGIDRLLHLSDLIAAQVVATPAYADAMTRALLGAQRDHHLVDTLLSYTVNVVTENLAAAAQAGELTRPETLAEDARILAGQQWGVLLLWHKGLLDLDAVPAAVRRGTLLPLVALCLGERRAALEAALAD